MTLHSTATHIPLSHEQHDEADTRLHGRWLLFAGSSGLRWSSSRCVSTLPAFQIMLCNPPWAISLPPRVKANGGTSRRISTQTSPY
jgi:hypothetical protein